MMNYRITGARWFSPNGFVAAPLHVVAGHIAAPSAGAYLDVPLADHLVLPGLINAHDHLQLNVIPPLEPETPFANSYDWIAAMSAHRARPDVAAAVALPLELRLRHGGLKNLLSGVTSVQHHDPWQALFAQHDFPVRVVSPGGWCHSPGLSGLNDEEYALLPQADLLRTAYAGLPQYGPRLRQSFAATPPATPWIIHLAEGNDAVAAAEPGLLVALDCFDARTVAVHAVSMGADDRRLWLDRGAAVIWCPAGNLRMLGRTLDPTPFALHGRLALGSDSRLSGGRDLLTELQVAAAHSDLEPETLLRLVTSDAAQVLKLADGGRLEPGCWADLLVLADPGGDPAAALLHAERADLRAVVRDGRPLLCDPDLGWWMRACGVESLAIRLDGRPKLIDRVLLGAAELLALEPGLT